MDVEEQERHPREKQELAGIEVGLEKRDNEQRGQIDEFLDVVPDVLHNGVEEKTEEEKQEIGRAHV